jgi:hypothetical protein
MRELRHAVIVLKSHRRAGELFDGNISRLGRVEHDLPFDGNGN